MKLYATYLKRYIRNYPFRILFLTLGVMITVLFISFMGMMTDSIHATNMEKRLDTYGKFHGIAIDISSQDIDAIKENKRLKTSAYSEAIGSIVAGYEKVYIGAMDEKSMELSRLHLKEGSWAETLEEIAVEDIALKNIKAEAKIGDEIDLNFIVLKDGESQTITKSFRLTGIFTNKSLRKMLENSYAMGGHGLEHIAMPAFIISNNMMSELKQEYHIQKSLFFELEDELKPTQINTTINLSVPILSNMLYNSAYRMQIEQYDKTLSSDNYILIFFINLFAIIGIIQCFYITIREREHQLGILRAIGAVKRQLQRIVFLEAIIILMIAIPLGIFFSIIALRYSVLFIESFSAQTQQIAILPKTIVTSITISSLSVMFAAFLPARKAMRVSPMAAISGVNEFTSLKRDEIITDNNLIGKKGIFNIAIRNLMRRKRHSVMAGIVVMLAIFTAIFSYNYDKMLIMEWKDMIKKEGTYSNRIWAMSSGSKLGKVMDENGMNIEQIEMLNQASGVLRVNSYKELNGALVGIPVGKSGEYHPYISRSVIGNNSDEWRNMQISKLETELLPVNFKVIGMSQSILSEIIPNYNGSELQQAFLYVPQMNLDYEKVGFSDLGLVENNMISIVYNGNKGNSEFDIAKFYLNSIVNSLPDPMANEEIFKGNICLLIDEKNFDILTNESLFNDIYVYPDETIDYKSALFSENITKIASMGRRLFEESKFDKMLEQRNESQILMLRLYVTTGVSVLLSLFIFSNMVISTVFARKQEFGILRAIGMSKAQLYKMLSIENCIVTLIAGIGSVLLMLFFILIRAITVNQTAYRYSILTQFPWLFSLMAIIFILIVTILISRYTLKKVLEGGIIEVIRRVE